MKAAAVALALALVPLAAALPAACADPCVVASDGAFGYRPAAVLLASGTSVVWTSSDYTHITADGRNLLDGGDRCLQVVHDVDAPSPPVRFDLAGGKLFATNEGRTQECRTATATPEGATMPYYCVLHPTMRGAIVVTR